MSKLIVEVASRRTPARRTDCIDVRSDTKEASLWPSEVTRVLLEIGTTELAQKGKYHELR